MLLHLGAMYKTRNTRTGKGMRGTRGIRNRGNVIFRGMLPNIPGNVLKHSGKCPQTFRGMSPNIPRECRQIIQGMSPNIPGNVLKHSGECPQTFQGMSPNIPGNVSKHSGECPLSGGIRVRIPQELDVVVF